MLSKRQRVPRGVFSSRKPAIRFATPRFFARVKPNTEGHNRFAVVVGTKVDKRSTKRNFIKRAVLGCAKEWPSLSSDIIIHITPAARDIPLLKLKEEIDELCIEATDFFKKKKSISVPKI